MPKSSRGGKRTIKEKKYALYDERYNKINAIKEQEKQNMIKLMRQGVVIPEARKRAREEAEAQIERINSEYDEKIFKLNESARGIKKTKVSSRNNNSTRVIGDNYRRINGIDGGPTTYAIYKGNELIRIVGNKKDADRLTGK